MKEKTFGQKQKSIMTFDKNMKYEDIIKEAEKLQSKYCSHSIVIDFYNCQFLAEGKESLKIDNEERIEILEPSNDVDFSSWRKNKDIENLDNYKKDLISRLKKKVGA